MKAGLLAAPGRIALEDRPEPVPGPGEVVVALAACGICGSDLEKVKGNYRATTVIGHEPVGTVAAVGPGVTGRVRELYRRPTPGAGRHPGPTSSRP